jgi:hypothetical protein
MYRQSPMRPAATVTAAGRQILDGRGYEERRSRCESECIASSRRGHGDVRRLPGLDPLPHLAPVARVAEPDAASSRIEEWYWGIIAVPIRSGVDGSYGS